MLWNSIFRYHLKLQDVMCKKPHWQVDNTKLLRTILQHLYAEYKKGMTKTETKNLFNRLQQIKQAPPSKTRNGKNVEFIEVRERMCLY